MARSNEPKKRESGRSRAKARACAGKHGVEHAERTQEQIHLKRECRERKGLAREIARLQNTVNQISDATQTKRNTRQKNKKKPVTSLHLQIKKNRRGPEGPVREPAGPACRAVFSTPEVAEMIFLELGMSDLLCGVIGTCRHWLRIVKSSTRLRQHLFFEPIPIAPLEYSPKLNDWTATDDSQGRHIVYEHPLLTRLNNLAVQLHIDASLRGEQRTGLQKIIGTRTNRDALKLRGTQSWQWSLLSQPPIADIYSKQDGKPYVVGYREQGIRMRNFLHKVHPKGRDDFHFYKPALQLYGYDTMAHYTGYAGLEGLIKAERARRAKGQ